MKKGKRELKVTGGQKKEPSAVGNGLLCPGRLPHGSRKERALQVNAVTTSWNCGSYSQSKEEKKNTGDDNVLK